jgi:small subunit ribosomal protein S2
MQKLPSAIWVVDTNKEHIAVGEARKLNIAVVGILDTNCDPDVVDYPIPGNDDALRAVGLLTHMIGDAIADGLMARAGGAVAANPVEAGVEPLADWEKELLTGESAEATPAAAVEAPAAE